MCILLLSLSTSSLVHLTWVSLILVPRSTQLKEQLPLNKSLCSSVAEKVGVYMHRLSPQSLSFLVDSFLSLISLVSIPHFAQVLPHLPMLSILYAPISLQSLLCPDRPAGVRHSSPERAGTEDLCPGKSPHNMPPPRLHPQAKGFQLR